MTKNEKWDQRVLKNGNGLISDSVALMKSKIQKCTATALGRTGVINKSGIDNKAYVMMLKGNLASGGGYDNS